MTDGDVVRYCLRALREPIRLLIGPGLPEPGGNFNPALASAP